MAPDNDERLVALAAAVADCEPVDWGTVESSAGSDDERRIIANLRVLAALGVVHRTETDDADLTHTAILNTASAAYDTQAVPRWGPFLLFERLGGGSQGDVFRAVDTRLDRQVALKFLKRPAGEHVLSEARLLARVRHPNVVTVYGADLIDGRVGLWMELITGDTLDASIIARGPMSAAEATIVGVDLCRAVGAVHLAGLLHRDVKAQNVMRESGGRYVLMDFGTGHAVDDAARGSRTAGTPLYLAPEILNGEPASIQSDIYALGVLLFYLTSGTYPATARSVGALTAEHREGHRRRLGETRTDLAPAFVAVIDRALDPDPRERFRTAAEMATALTRSMAGFLPAEGDASGAAPRPWRRYAAVAGLGVAALAGALQAGSWLRSGSRTPPPISGPRTVAVLAFEDLSNDQSGRTLSEGLSDLLITNLGQQPELSVMARTSSRQFAGNRRALDLAREFSVNFIVEGSVRPSGRSWTASTRVVSAASGTLLAGFTRDTDLAHLGETVGEMARAVATALQVPPRDVRATAPIDADAMEAYIRGWSEYWRLTREGFQEAERLFTKTTERAPNYAPGHAALAYVTFQLEKAYKAYPPGVGAATAMNEARTALRYDPDSPQALAALGWVEFYGSWHWQKGEELLRRAVELNPSDAQNRWMYAQLLMAENRLDAALEEARLVQRLDPLTPARYSNIATVLYYDRQNEEALREAQRLLTRDPNATVGHFGMARFLSALGKHDEAITMIQTSGNANEPPVRAELARIFTVANREAEARALLPGLEQDYRAGRLAPDYYAFVKLARHQPDEALRLLDQAVTEHSPSVIWIQVDPRFDELRQQPKFTELLRRIGLAS